MITVDFSLMSRRLVGLRADSCTHCVTSLRHELQRLPG